MRRKNVKVLLFCCKGFEMMEFAPFYDICGWAKSEYGFFEEAYDERFLDLIRTFNEQGKIIASICVAALPIGKSGVLKNRNATTYHLCDAYRQKELAGFSVNVINEPIVVDQNIITSYCPRTANDVAFLLMEKLIGEERTSVIKHGMGW